MKFTLTKFDSGRIKAICKAIDIKNAPILNNDNYIPNSMTPLYDAIAKTIHDTEKVAKGKDVLCVIMTDGEENASKEYTRDKIFGLIKEKEKEKWSFIYLGANQDSWDIGYSIGLHKGNVIDYNQKNTKQTISYISQTTCNYANMSTNERNIIAKNILPDKDKTEKELTK